MNRGSSRQVLECASPLVFPPSRRAIAPLRRDGGWRFGDGGEPTKSARGLAQSKTLPRNPQVHGPNACAKAKGGLSMNPTVRRASRLPPSAKPMVDLLWPPASCRQRNLGNALPTRHWQHLIDGDGTVRLVCSS